MDIERLKYALALKSVEGVGNVVFDRLIRRFGTPQDAFRQDIASLLGVQGLSPKAAGCIASFRSWSRIDRELELAYKYKITIMTVDDPSYPELLRTIHDRPAVLYVKGTLIPDEACIAVVGSRRASTYGKFTTEKFCRELALSGLNVVSGMARGIDSAAHRGALSAGGRTIAVLGSGLDVVYPAENAGLCERIAGSGAVISEYPFQAQPLPANFPERNRIISGMALGTIIMEATEKSGSLITARCALDQGREVFAVPGSIDQPGSKGTHKLIKEGAKLVENIFDIIDEIAPRLKREAVPSPERSPGTSFPGGRSGEVAEQKPGIGRLDPVESAVLGVLSKGMLQVDSIIRQTRLASSAVLNSLLTLELKGYVEQMPGKIFKKR